MKPSEAEINAVPRILYWFLCVLIAVVVVVVRFIIAPSDYGLGNLVVSSISGLLVAFYAVDSLTLRMLHIPEESEWQRKKHNGQA